jgi:hypothetical protein
MQFSPCGRCLFVARCAGSSHDPRWRFGDFCTAEIRTFTRFTSPSIPIRYGYFTSATAHAGNRSDGNSWGDALTYKIELLARGRLLEQHVRMHQEVLRNGGASAAGASATKQEWTPAFRGLLGLSVPRPPPPYRKSTAGRFARSCRCSLDKDWRYRSHRNSKGDPQRWLKRQLQQHTAWKRALWSTSSSRGCTLQERPEEDQRCCRCRQNKAFLRPPRNNHLAGLSVPGPGLSRTCYRRVDLRCQRWHHPTA